jgi:hypothetical protein
LLGKCLEKAFQENISDPLESENILALAWKFQVPQFDQMFQDHQDHDYLPFNLTMAIEINQVYKTLTGKFYKLSSSTKVVFII